ESRSNALRKAVQLSPVAIGVLRETGDGGALPSAPEEMARLIKALPVTLTGHQSLDRAISTAGGVQFDQVDENLMLKSAPGIFVAGEMLDWDAPTGGYLLQASFATAAMASDGVVRMLGASSSDKSNSRKSV